MGTSTWVSAGGEGADPQAAAHRSCHGPRSGPPERPLTAPCIDQLMHTSGVAGLGHPPEFREPVAPGLGVEGRTLAQHDSRVTTIMVRDHGIGIGAEQLPVFFTRFGR